MVRAYNTKGWVRNEVVILLDRIDLRLEAAGIRAGGINNLILTCYCLHSIGIASCALYLRLAGRVGIRLTFPFILLPET